MCKLDALFELNFDRSFIGFIFLVANDSGTFPFSNEEGKRSELQRKPLREDEQLFLTLEQLVEHEC